MKERGFSIAQDQGHTKLTQDTDPGVRQVCAEAVSRAFHSTVHLGCAVIWDIWGQNHTGHFSRAFFFLCLES